MVKHLTRVTKLPFGRVGDVGLARSNYFLTFLWQHENSYGPLVVSERNMEQEFENDDSPADAGKPVSKLEQHRKEFVDKVLDLMQKGEMFWQRPWDVAGLMPVNAVTQKAYQGCNIAYLLLSGMIRKYTDPRWVTYKQAQDNGWQVLKGEHGTKIEYWSVVRNEDPDRRPGEISSRDLRNQYFCKIYTVFNASQVDGLPPLEAESERDKKEFVFHDRSENIMDNCGVPISYGGGDACYIPSQDRICLPERDRFHDEAHFYATALHEISHSTGHPYRLNRVLSGTLRSPKYAQEELRAEMASAFLQMELGFPLTEAGMKEHTEKHAAYVQSWLSHLQKDYREFFRATQDAAKISDYVLGYEKAHLKTKTLNGPQTAKDPAALTLNLFNLRQYGRVKQ
jgi:antirestriction protein ArdC